MIATLSLVASATLFSSQAPTQDVAIHIRADRPTVAVKPSMYGVFFEEINQAGEGGLYAEMLRTRGMEDATERRLPSGWKARGPEGSVAVDSSSPHAARPWSLRIASGASAVNEGFWGIRLQPRGRYRLKLWYRSDTPVGATLEGPDAKTLGRHTFKATGGEWQKAEAALQSAAGATKAVLSLSPEGNGTAYVAFASLMPPQTWKGRANGLRPDLAEKISSIRPGFVRFPGGCFVEGHDLAQAFNWKKSLGPVEERPPFPRILWGYPSSNGLGFHEYLQWCEDMGTPALFVANCGMSHSQVAPMAEMNRYVQDILYAIEYANGPATSTWGALRAKNGHPAPFNLRYLQVGNENGGPAYDERYALIYKAVQERYPEVNIVANVWGGVPKSAPLQIIDEHYYNSPSFFWRNAGRYDRYDRKGPVIYVGEYAVTQGSGTGNLAAALSEAAFMTGMERNADVVQMASYAPLFVNVNNRQWNPNAVVFDNSRSYGTPSYWVQYLFGNHRPDRVLEHRVEAPAGTMPTLSGRAGLQTWRTQAEFRNIQLEADGQVIVKGGELVREQLQDARGDWGVSDGVVRQMSMEENRRAVLRHGQLPEGAKKIIYRMQARKIGGDEGFIVMLAAGPQFELQWNLGGWVNTVHAFQVNGERTGAGVPGKIETDRWYDIRIEREGNITRGFLDGKLVEEITDQPVADFAAVAGIDEKRNEIVIKAVNGSASPRDANLVIDGARLGSEGSVVVLRGSDLMEENSFDAPEKISPRRSKLTGVAARMKVRLEPYSVTVIRLPRRRG